MANKKNNFLVPDEWGPMFLKFTDEQAGQLIKAAFLYHRGEPVDLKDPVLCAVFAMMRDKIDANDEHYKQICEQRRKAVNARWNKEANTNEYTSNQTNTKDTDMICNDMKCNDMKCNDNNIKARKRTKTNFKDTRTGNLDELMRPVISTGFKA